MIEAEQTKIKPLLEVKDFSLRFRTFGKGLREKEDQVIHNLNLTIYPGEIVAVVGASGSGKSLLADAILGILPENAMIDGTLHYKGESLTKKRLKELRGKEITLIPQSVNALDPLMKTGKQVQATLKGSDRQAVQQSIFKKIGLSEETDQLYPFELSGGMSRRVLVSTALASQAKLIIADEPTPGLDPAVLDETLRQMKSLIKPDKGMMFITHDIDVATKIADKIVVFYEGETVDVVKVEAFSGQGEQLKHSYTKALWKALPQNEFTLSFKQEKTNKEMKASELSTKSYSTANRPLLVKGISYRYPDSPWLFKNLNLTINPGEIVGISGYSGSGKSTMAQVIGGYKKPKEGIVMLGDRPATFYRVHPVQIVWQHPEKAINPRWRLKKLVKETGGLDQEIMHTFDIKIDWLKRWPSELSGGELQRFSLARALSSDNIRFLVADEMTTMLDAVTQARIWQTVIQLAEERGIGILVISHNQYLLTRIANRVVDFMDIS